MSIEKHLGQKSEYASQYDRGLLVREDRQPNRDTVGLTGGNLPFVGYDVWNAYEISCLTTRGRPIAGVAKIMYPCTSPYIVESKSIKLYLNSFNMTRIADTADECIREMQRMISKDLSNLLQTDVQCKIHNASSRDFTVDDSFKPSCLFTTLENDNATQDIVFKHFQETPELLTRHVTDSGFTGCYHSALLKSNCKVTHQPDWGDVYIMMESDSYPSKSDLLEYIVSFRDENHFHEEICETIFTRLYEAFKPRDLVVYCLYVRRGGIDINPIRSLHLDGLSHELTSIFSTPIKTCRQ